MQKPSSSKLSHDELRDKLIGLGEHSVRKSYYPELQKQLANLSERVELAELVAEIGQGLTEERELRSSLQRCSDSLKQRTSAALVRIWTIDSTGEFLELQASSGLHTSIEGKHSRLYIKDYPYKIGKIAREKKPILTNEVAGDPLFHDQKWVEQQGIISFAGYPLLLQQKLIGVVALFAKKQLNEAVLDTLSTITTQIAVSVERKRAEDELIEYRNKLEVLVEDRTLKLQEAQSELIQNERLATLGRLTATVSHELRNPLGTIRTAVFSIGECLQRDDHHNIERALKLAERNIIRCVNIIEELVTYTRVKKMNMTQTSVNDWLQTILKELSVPKEIQLELDLCTGIQAQIDQEKLLQAMINLVNNAVHALTDENSQGKLLKISTCLLDSLYEIHICDNGVGMTDETKEKIFEPLYSTKSFGVGLGMVIVKNIVEQHHGKINIESQAGEGTIVTLRLPMNQPEA